MSTPVVTFFESLFKDRQESGNGVLIRAMRDCSRADNPFTRERLFRALLESTLFVPVDHLPDPVKPGELKSKTADEKTVFRFLTRVLHTGELVTPVFTDRQMLCKWYPYGVPFIGLSALTLCQLLVKAQVPLAVLCTPFTSLKLQRWEIKELADGNVPRPMQAAPGSIPRGTRIAFTGLNTPLSSGLRQQLQSVLGPCTDVAAIYIFLMRRNNRAPEFTVGVHFSSLPDGQGLCGMMEKIALLIKPHLPSELAMTFIPLKDRDAIFRNLSAMLPAFYQRNN